MMMMMSFVLDLNGDDEDVLDLDGYLNFYQQTASRHILLFRDNQSVRAQDWINP
jgi:hypothetical protein